MRQKSFLSALALSALLFGGCAELRTPRASQPLPTALLPPRVEPLRAATRMAAADFADQGSRLQGHPAETARAIGRLEWLTATLSTDPRYAALPQGVAMSLRGAAAETRAALGIVPDAPPARVTAVLTETASALDRGADPSFPADLFPAGPERSMQRLRAPGPFPQAGIATGQAAEAIAALDRDGGWNRGAGQTGF
ncbi:hypothetical protein [Roseomonas marmotae]|uniref:Uncharacterized protein n=1 Tax=Roseomonas marmotae TaxID=2768161 RepID=A0ABS3K9Z5_9PROT|nr:hypothetical protein [Roseomonas marmotae]MBO1073760.1 hypothetical protein [Roseomonas marmotae]QTI78608.1 hypothetical protein IAI58_13140 [Roseomonas marmotae]